MKAELGAAVFTKLLTRFVRETDDFMTRVNQNWATDVTTAAAECHKIAGSAAVFGALAFRTALITLENAAKDNDPEHAAQVLGTLPDIWKETRALLSETASGEQ